MDTTKAPLLIVTGLCLMAGGFLVRSIPKTFWKHPPRSDAEHRWRITYVKATLALVGAGLVLIGLILWLFGSHFPTR